MIVIGHELTSFMFQNNIFYNGPQECQVDQGGRENGTEPEEDGQGAQEAQGGGGLPKHQVKGGEGPAHQDWGWAYQSQ